MATPVVAADLDVPDEDAERNIRLVNAGGYVGGLVNGIGDVPVQKVCVEGRKHHRRSQCMREGG